MICPVTPGLAIPAYSMRATAEEMRTTTFSQSISMEAIPIDLTPFEGVKCELIDDLPDSDDEVLFQMNQAKSRII